MINAIWQSIVTLIIGIVSYNYFIPMNSEDNGIIITICVMGFFIIANINQKKS